MSDRLRRLSLVFSAGSLGGLTNSIVVWAFGALGVSGALGVAIRPTWSPPWLYPRIVWGGLWGFLFLLPLLKNSLWLRGLLLSLGPTLVQLFVVFPYKAQKGVLGLELGLLTPILVVIFNACWGLTAAWWLRRVE